MTEFLHNFMGWYGALLLFIGPFAIIPFCMRTRKLGVRTTWRNVEGPSLVLGLLLIPAIIAVLLGGIESIFDVDIPSLVTGAVVLFNALVFWRWTREQGGSRRL